MVQSHSRMKCLSTEAILKITNKVKFTRYNTQSRSRAKQTNIPERNFRVNMAKILQTMTTYVDLEHSGVTWAGELKQGKQRPTTFSFKIHTELS